MDGARPCRRSRRSTQSQSVRVPGPFDPWRLAPGLAQKYRRRALRSLRTSCRTSHRLRPFSHRLLDGADDGHRDAAADTTSSDVADNRRHVEPTAAAAQNPQSLKDGAADSPPRIPASEFPMVPRLCSFMAAPAALPPTAPLRTLTTRLAMFMSMRSSRNRPTRGSAVPGHSLRAPGRRAMEIRQTQEKPHSDRD
jgi:hypothetical protein